MSYIAPTDAPISDDWQQHRIRHSLEPGTDYACAYGTDLRAPESGTVLTVDRDPGGPAGRRLTLLLDDGRVVDWIHLAEIMTRPGARFERGQTGLARSGASAGGDDWGSGIHVHVTLRADRWRALDDTLDFEDHLTTPNPTEEPTVSMKLIRKPDGSIFLIDETGSDHLGDFKTDDIGLGELIQSAERVFGDIDQLTDREFDVAVAIAERRADRHRKAIALEVVKILRQP